MKEKILNDILNQFNHMKSEDMALLKKLPWGGKDRCRSAQVYKFYLETDYITQLVEKFEQIMKK